MSELIVISVGGRYARAIGVRRDTAGNQVPVPLLLEQTLDGARRISLDRMATVVCSLGGGRWAGGRWAREAALRCPETALNLGCLWEGARAKAPEGLDALAWFLKDLFRTATRGSVQPSLALVYKDETHRRWLERAAALAGLPLLPGGWIPRAEALSAGLALRCVAHGESAVLDMGGSSSTLYHLTAAGKLRWLGSSHAGSASHLAGLLAAGMSPERQGLEGSAEDYLEEMARLYSELGDRSLSEQLDLYVPGERPAVLSPGKAWDIMLPRLSPELTESPGDFAAKGMQQAGVVPPRLLLVGGMAGLGFPPELFPLPAQLVERPDWVELEGAAVLASGISRQSQALFAPGHWAEEQSALQRLCQAAREESARWEAACREIDRQLAELREQLGLKESQAALHLEELVELRGLAAKLRWELEQAKAPPGNREARSGSKQDRDQARPCAGTCDELERLRKRCRRLEKRIREIKQQAG